MSNESEITTVQGNQGFMRVSTLDSAMQISELIAKSSFCPKGLSGRPGDILVCLQMGQELGLKPMQALQNIAVINGRPSLWGDAMLGVCRQSPDFEFIKENYDEATETAFCVVKRRNEPEFIQKFSKDDAIKAKLWNKEGPWTSYPRRMQQMRARGFALRDSFPDLLRGIIVKEEADDMPPEKPDYSKHSGIVVDHIADAEFIDQKSLSDLRERIAQAGSEEADVCSYLKIDCLENMLNGDIYKIRKMLSKKIEQKKTNELPINKMLESEPIEPEMSAIDKEFFGE